MVWRYLPFGVYTGEYNMSLDRDLLECLRTGERNETILRLYCWDRPTISLGTNQTPDQVVVLEQVARLGYGLVTRPTGGRALLHKGDICYAIIANRGNHPEFRSLTSTYRAIAQALAKGLSSLGVQTTELPQSGTPVRSTLNPCFAMVNPFEVTVRGRKICGSAQFRSGDYFLQHGSIRILDNWSEDDLGELWPSGYRIDRESITSVEGEVGQAPEMSVVVDSLRQAFQSRFGVKFEPA